MPLHRNDQASVDLEQNQSLCILMNFIVGRHSLHPSDEDLSPGTRC